MTSDIPVLEQYPKTLNLRDGSKVVVHLLTAEDELHLYRFFQRVPASDRHYLKDDVTSPEVIHAWTAEIDYERVIPIVAVAGDRIVADATLHRSRAPARRHIGELRIVVDPEHRQYGLGRQLIRELVNISTALGLHKATFQLVENREHPAIMAAHGEHFEEVARLKDWIQDEWGNFQDLVFLEYPLKEMETRDRY
ncbi:MAG: GNAT family N-acetyltransferase [Chloroflexi bacterium]|nr:GNAT family N-acetyltransferase [Chloroflexota bacterium]